VKKLALAGVPLAGEGVAAVTHQPQRRAQAANTGERSKVAMSSPLLSGTEPRSYFTSHAMAARAPEKPRSVEFELMLDVHAFPRLIFK
jgi:hypothetical protein